jgi:hypothetical protein
LYQGWLSKHKLQENLNPCFNLSLVLNGIIYFLFKRLKNSFQCAAEPYVREVAEVNVAHCAYRLKLSGRDVLC